MQQEDKPIFRNYEIKNFDFSPLIYKLLGAAAIFNLVAIIVMAQAQIFTTRGCESPMVSRVCEVIDTIYVGGTMLGSDSTYVEKIYNEEEIKDADITYIDVSGQAPPFTYPADYFALANPESQFENVTNPADASANPSGIPGIPGISNSTTTVNPTLGNTDLSTIQPVTPSPNKNAVTGNIPTSPFEMSPNPIPNPIGGRTKSSGGFKSGKSKIKNNSPNELPKFPEDLTAENNPPKNPTDPTQPEPKSEPVKEVEINKKPLQDFAETILVKREEQKPVDLTKNFTVVLDGTIAADGTFDTKKSRFVKGEGDEEMVNVAKDAIEAFGRSGTFGYLRNLDVEKFTFTLIQDDQKIYAIITSEQKTPEEARTITSGFNGLIKGVFFADESGLKKLGEDEKLLLNKAKATSKNKQFILNFEMPKQDAQAMINRNLEKEEKKRAERKNQPGQTTGQTDNSNQRADK